MTLRIDPEFRDLIPPLTVEEWEQFYPPENSEIELSRVDSTAPLVEILRITRFPNDPDYCRLSHVSSATWQEQFTKRAIAKTALIRAFQLFEFDYQTATKKIISYAAPTSTLDVERTPSVEYGPIIGGVYFIQAGAGPIKIGFSNDVIERMALLQTGNAEALILRGVIRSTDRTLESQMHRKFQEDWIRGEWFSPSRLLLNFIADSTEGIE